MSNQPAATQETTPQKVLNLSYIPFLLDVIRDAGFDPHQAEVMTHDLCKLSIAHYEKVVQSDVATFTGVIWIVPQDNTNLILPVLTSRYAQLIYDDMKDWAEDKLGIFFSYGYARSGNHYTITIGPSNKSQERFKFIHRLEPDKIIFVPILVGTTTNDLNPVLQFEAQHNKDHKIRIGFLTDTNAHLLVKDTLPPNFDIPEATLTNEQHMQDIAQAYLDAHLNDNKPNHNVTLEPK